MENLNLVELKQDELQGIEGGQNGQSRNKGDLYGATTQGEVVAFFNGLIDGLFGFS